jgi:outer membrane protein, multidrug efflux system
MAEERQGIVAHQAVLLQESAVAELETVIPPLEQQLATTKDALAILVGDLPEELQLGSGSLDTLKQPTIKAGQPSELLARRPDIREAEENLIAANADIRVARAQFLPSFSFDLNGGINALQLPGGTIPALAVYSLLSNVTQPIFKGGALVGQLDQANARYQELLIGTYRKTVLTALGEVEDALATVKATAAERAAQQRAVSTSLSSAGVANNGLRGGTGTILTVLTAQSAVYHARGRRDAFASRGPGKNKTHGHGWLRRTNGRSAACA